MKHIILALSLLSIAACASAGPVVTNISYDAGGDLVVEKCKVKSNFFLGTMELEECNTHNMKIKAAAEK
jgi:hypothetical protein